MKKFNIKTNKDRKQRKSKEEWIGAEESQVRISLLLPESVRENFKIKATKNKTDMSDVLREYINRYIET